VATATTLQYCVMVQSPNAPHNQPTTRGRSPVAVVRVDADVRPDQSELGNSMADEFSSLPPRRQR
jgi:hypothetical protein